MKNITFYIFALLYIILPYSAESSDGFKYASTDTNCYAVLFEADTICDTWYWRFCSSNSIGLPDEIAIHTIQGTPAYSEMVKDDNGVYHLFTSLYFATSQRLARLDYNNGLQNAPTVNYVTVNGIPSNVIRNEGIKIIKVGNNYYGFLALSSKLYRIEFGNNLLNNNVVATEVNGISGAYSWAHSLDIYFDGTKWWGIVTARSSKNIVVLEWGSNILGDVLNYTSYGYNDASQFTNASHVISDGNHYIFACDFINGLIRFDFGNALSNSPAIHNLGLFLSGNQWGIELYKECGENYTGLLTDESGSDHKVLQFSNGIDQPPTVGQSFDNINRVSSLTSAIREGNDIIFVATLAYEPGVALLRYNGCLGNIMSMDIEPPFVIDFKSTGSYIVELIVNEGLPTQNVFCEAINVEDCPITNVPTMTQWGLFLFALLMVILGLVTIWNLKKKRAEN